MGEDKSLEQVVESYSRQITETRGKLLEDFYLAYAAHMTEKCRDLNIDDICLVEYQCDGQYSMNRKYWFEHKPKFIDT